VRPTAHRSDPSPGVVLAHPPENPALERRVLRSTCAMSSRARVGLRGERRVKGAERVDPADGSRATATLIIEGPITRADIGALCARLRGLLERGDVDLLICDLDAGRPDAVTIDALARLLLTTRRSGRRIRFRNGCREVRELVAFCGLDDVLHLDGSSRVEPRWEAEQREQGRGVQEERDP
jgi:ABC-type transporter Mla MlaB component